jgi:deazaflavin-dependent oxidoreductase (nitroreductase family)
LSEPEDFNARIVEEFRTNGGKVGGGFEGAPMILIHHQGARSGTWRVHPLVYLPVGNSFAVFASKGGAPHPPHWYLNLKAHPDADVEMGSETISVSARELEGEERREIWERQKQAMPAFAEYEEKTRGRREIPVVLLERRS